MPINKSKKTEIYNKLVDASKVAQSWTFVKFNGLTVADSTAMRKELREKNVKYFVAKKAIAAKALAEAKFEGALPELPGEIAFAWSEDALASAQGVNEFVKKFADRVSIVGGVFEGKYQDAIAMNAIANIPPLQTLRGMFVNIINSPIQRFAMVLSEVAKKKETTA